MIDDDGTFIIGAFDEYTVGRPRLIHFLRLRKEILHDVTVFVVAKVTRQEAMDYQDRHFVDLNPFWLRSDARFYRVRMD